MTTSSSNAAPDRRKGPRDQQTAVRCECGDVRTISTNYYGPRDKRESWRKQEGWRWLKHARCSHAGRSSFTRSSTMAGSSQAGTAPKRQTERVTPPGGR